MEERFRMTKESGTNAILNMVFDIWAMQSAIGEKFAEWAAEKEGLPLSEVQFKMNKVVQNKKRYIQDHVFAHFGKMNLDDILPAH